MIIFFCFFVVVKEDNDGYLSHVEQQMLIIIKKNSFATYKFLVILYFPYAQMVKEWKMN